MGSYLNGFDLYANAVQVAIIGRRGEPATDALVRAAYTVSVPNRVLDRSEEHTSELQSLMRISYADFCLKKKTLIHTTAMTPDKCAHKLESNKHSSHRRNTKQNNDN